MVWTYYFKWVQNNHLNLLVSPICFPVLHSKLLSVIRINNAYCEEIKHIENKRFVNNRVLSSRFDSNRWITKVTKAYGYRLSYGTDLETLLKQIVDSYDHEKTGVCYLRC